MHKEQNREEINEEVNRKEPDRGEVSGEEVNDGEVNGGEVNDEETNIKKFVIGEFVFDTFHEYRDGQEDTKKIECINRELDVHDPEVAVRLYNDIRSGEIVFKSPIGDQFFAHLADIVADKSVGLLEDKAVVEEAEGKVKYQKVIGLACMAAAVVFFTIFGISEVRDILSARKASERLQQVQQGASGGAPQGGEIGGDSSDELAEEPYIDVSTLTVLPEYLELYQQNPEMVGWLAIEGTGISYPVVQRAGDNEYYLRHSFEGKDDSNGTLFVDCRSDIVNQTTNTIIYGHNMRSGMMFGSLKEYLEPSYYESHKTIQFNTIYERRLYEVVAVCMSEVKYQDENDYRYYDFIQAENEAEFEAFLANVRALSVYGEGISLTKSDKILTLSTCNSYTEDGRLFIVAKRVE